MFTPCLSGYSAVYKHPMTSILCLSMILWIFFLHISSHPLYKAKNHDIAAHCRTIVCCKQLMDHHTPFHPSPTSATYIHMHIILPCSLFHPPYSTTLHCTILAHCNKFHKVNPAIRLLIFPYFSRARIKTSIGHNSSLGFPSLASLGLPADRSQDLSTTPPYLWLKQTQFNIWI